MTLSDSEKSFYEGVTKAFDNYIERETEKEKSVNICLNEIISMLCVIVWTAPIFNENPEEKMYQISEIFNNIENSD